MSDPSHHDAKPPIQSTAGRQAQASVDPDPDPTLPDHPEADHADPRKGPALAKRTKRSSHSHSDPKLESDLRVEHDAQYILLLQDIKDDITRWAKARLWIIALVGAIVGGLGGYHVFEETMRSLVETRVNEQLTHLQAQSDKAVDKFAVDYQKSVDQLSLLKATNDVTVDTSRTAQATIKAAKDDLEALDKKSKQIESSIDDAEKKISGLISDSANHAHDDTFEAASLNNLFDALQNLQFDYIENRLSSIEDAITEVNDHSGDVVKLKEIVSSLVDKKNNLRSAYLERARHLEDNSKIKVILYYKTGEGFSPQTLIASNRLKALGYKTDIWTTHPGNVADARADIAKDFKGATAAIDANKSAIAVSDQEKYHAMEIKNELTSLNIFHDMPVVPVDLEPNSVFLQRPPEEDYPKSAIILVFVLSET